MFPKILCCAGTALFLGIFLSACATKQPAYASPPADAANQQPDKLLFDRSVDAIEHSHYEQARLTLQTLINTYPNSEYLPQAKLAMADSWYREGSVASLKQAHAECQEVLMEFRGTPYAEQAAQLMTKIEQDLAKKGSQ